MLNYAVTVSHPTGLHSGVHELTVRSTTGNAACRYVSGNDFGCSRDYVTVSDESAIRSFLAEHACKATAIKSLSDASSDCLNYGQITILDDDETAALPTEPAFNEVNDSECSDAEDRAWYVENGYLPTADEIDYSDAIAEHDHGFADTDIGM